MLTLDKIAKIGAAGVRSELTSKGVNSQVLSPRGLSLYHIHREDSLFKRGKELRGR